MNVQMWGNPATQRNLAQIRADGIHIFGPANGEQACGEIGDGRMIEADRDFIATATPIHRKYWRVNGFYSPPARHLNN